MTSAVHLYRYKTDDAILLNIVGYHLQQAVELALKHCLEMEGKDYPKTHDINDLLAHFSAAADWETLCWRTFPRRRIGRRWNFWRRKLPN